MLKINIFLLLLFLYTVAAYRNGGGEFGSFSRRQSGRRQIYSNIYKIPRKVVRSVGSLAPCEPENSLIPERLYKNETQISECLWNQIIKMEQVILSVQFNNQHLNVWQESRQGYNRFYVTPLSILETASIKCTKDGYSNFERFALTFNIKLWDLKAAEKVKIELEQKKIVAKITDILPLPMLKLRLGINAGISEKIEIDKEWRPNLDQPNSLAFELYTKDEELCKQMEKDAKSDPENFLTRTKLFLEFTMVVEQKTAYRNLNISGETFVKSNFFNYLDNNNYGNKSGMIYLTLSDLNNLAKDVFYMASLFQEDITSTYISTEEESQIISGLLNVLKGQPISSNSLTKDEWNSVFWGDIFSRPDIQTEYFNQVLKYNESEGLFKYDEKKDIEFRQNILNKYPLEKQKQVGFYFKNLGSDSRVFYKDSVKKEELPTFLANDNVNVQWTGKKFIPKNFELFRLNTKNLKTSGEILFKRNVLTKVAPTQRIEIRPELYHQIIDVTPPKIGFGTYQSSDNWTQVFGRFEKEINAFIVGYANFQGLLPSQDVVTRINDLQKQFQNISKEIEAKISSVETRLTDWNFKQIQKANQNYATIDQALSVDNRLTAQINEIRGKNDILQNQNNNLQKNFNDLDQWVRVGRFEEAVKAFKKVFPFK